MVLVEQEIPCLLVQITEKRGRIHGNGRFRLGYDVVNRRHIGFRHRRVFNVPGQCERGRQVLPGGLGQFLRQNGFQLVQVGLVLCRHRGELGQDLVEIRRLRLLQLRIAQELVDSDHLTGFGRVGSLLHVFRHGFQILLQVVKRVGLRQGKGPGTDELPQLFLAFARGCGGVDPAKHRVDLGESRIHPTRHDFFNRGR